jgi:hypothetical protein
MRIKYRNSHIVAENLTSFSFKDGWLNLVPQSGPVVEAFDPENGQAIFDALCELHGPVLEVLEQSPNARPKPATQAAPAEQPEPEPEEALQPA